MPKLAFYMPFLQGHNLHACIIASVVLSLRVRSKHDHALQVLVLKVAMFSVKKTWHIRHICLHLARGGKLSPSPQFSYSFNITIRLS